MTELLLDVDCEVLRLYNLPAALERSLLDVFTAWDRVGVPYLQACYIPKAFKADISLSAYRELARDWGKTNQERGTLIDQSIRGELGKQSETQSSTGIRGVPRLRCCTPLSS